MTEASEAQDPIGRRVLRIRQLEDLAERVAAELREERVSLARSLAARSRIATTYPLGVQAPTADIRTWARENGWPHLGNRGRLPRGLAEAYAAAHPERSFP